MDNPGFSRYSGPDWTFEASPPAWAQEVGGAAACLAKITALCAKDFTGDQWLQQPDAVDRLVCNLFVLDEGAEDEQGADA